MNLFQGLALALLAALAAVTVAATLRSSLARRDGVIWLLVWLLAGVCILWPGLTVRLARALGIGRGADLVLYCTVVMTLVGFLMIYVRLRRLQREVTILTRHLAIRDALQASRESSGPPPKESSASQGS